MENLIKKYDKEYSNEYLNTLNNVDLNRLKIIFMQNREHDETECLIIPLKRIIKLIELRENKKIQIDKSNNYKTYRQCNIFDV